MNKMRGLEEWYICEVACLTWIRQVKSIKFKTPGVRELGQFQNKICGIFFFDLADTLGCYILVFIFHSAA